MVCHEHVTSRGDTIGYRNERRRGETIVFHSTGCLTTVAVYYVVGDRCDRGTPCPPFRTKVVDPENVVGTKGREDFCFCAKNQRRRFKVYKRSPLARQKCPGRLKNIPRRICFRISTEIWKKIFRVADGRAPTMKVVPRFFFSKNPPAFYDLFGLTTGTILGFFFRRSDERV